MKSILYSLSLFICVAAAAQEPAAVPRQADEIISRTGQILAPDRRLALFNAAAEMHGDTLVVKGETTAAGACDTLLAALAEAGVAPVRCEIEQLPEAGLGDRCVGVITVSTALLRRGPSEKEEIINQALLGETFTLLKDTHYFDLVQLGDGYIGYIDGGSTAVMSRSELAAWESRPKVLFWKKWGEIRSEKNDQSVPVSDIVLGTSVTLVKKEGKWLRVALADGREGYLRRDEVIEAGKFARQPKPTPTQLVATARQFTGYPYLWGGRSTKGFDCSGFTLTIYKLHGISLPRDANMQVHAGREVPVDSSFSMLQPGDLLFFGRTRSRITHVGMYIGDYRFIHSGDLVLINSFNPAHADFSPRRARDLQAVRRIL